MRPYEERKTARIGGLRARAAAKSAESETAWKRMDGIAAIIPLGQPILVGHHSERRHRRDLKRIDQAMRKSVAASHEAAELERRADAAEASAAVSSDDPEAIEKLRAKLADIERQIARAKATSLAIRAAKRRADKGGDKYADVARAALVDLGFREATIARLLEPDYDGRVVIPSFFTTNLGAQRRRIAGRIAELEAKASRPAPAPEQYGSVRIEESENRVRIYFPGKPAGAVRTELKSHGFRWSSTEGAWQRHASQDAWYWARKIAATRAS